MDNTQDPKKTDVQEKGLTETERKYAEQKAEKPVTVKSVNPDFDVEDVREALNDILATPYRKTAALKTGFTDEQVADMVSGTKKSANEQDVIEAFVNILKDNASPKDISVNTGLSEKRCNEIADLFHRIDEAMKGTY